MNLFIKKLLASCIRGMFAILSLLPQQNTIAFLSRQSAKPFDFQLLEPEFNKHFPEYKTVWACVPKGGELGIVLFLKQLYLVATSKVCFVDGYVPAVSIPSAHKSVCIQLWHASGAIKKFGYQCLDTPAGRSSEDAEAFRMHKGYDYVIAGCYGARPAFAQAFHVNVGNILSLGLPRQDYLLSPEYEEMRQEDIRAVKEQLGISEGSNAKVVLYAPTFRKGNSNSNWLEENVMTLARAFAGKDVLLVVAGHPLDKVFQWELSNEGVRVVTLESPTIKALQVADAVISDYSAIALDAGIIGKRVLFYVPDIEEYRESPGLNVDPWDVFPIDTFAVAADIVDACFKEDKYRTKGTFSAFINEYAGNVEGGSISSALHLLSGIIR